MTAKIFLNREQYEAFKAMYGCEDLTEFFRQLLQPGVARAMRFHHANDRRHVRRNMLSVAGMPRRAAHRFLDAQGTKRERETGYRCRTSTTAEVDRFWKEQRDYWKKVQE